MRSATSRKQPLVAAILVYVTEVAGVNHEMKHLKVSSSLCMVGAICYLRYVEAAKNFKIISSRDTIS
jgi:hypothetical protein